MANEIMRTTDTVGWAAGLRTIWRVTRLSWQSPVMVTIALGATLVASCLQLIIPILLGRAVDQTQLLLNGGTEAAQDALWATAWLVLAVAMARGVFTVFQNYFSESVGHMVGYRLRLAYY